MLFYLLYLQCFGHNIHDLFCIIGLKLILQHIFIIQIYSLSGIWKYAFYNVPKHHLPLDFLHQKLYLNIPVWFYAITNPLDVIYYVTGYPWIIRISHWTGENLWRAVRREFLNTKLITTLPHRHANTNTRCVSSWEGSVLLHAVLKYGNSQEWNRAAHRTVWRRYIILKVS